MKYENITHILKTVFVSDFGFSEEMAINIYLNSLASSGKKDVIRNEISEALEDDDLSWKKLLFNDDYEVRDFDTEEEAKAFALKVLLEPIQ